MRGLDFSLRQSPPATPLEITLDMLLGVRIHLPMQMTFQQRRAV